MLKNNKKEIFTRGFLAGLVFVLLFLWLAYIYFNYQSKIQIKASLDDDVEWVIME